MSRIPIKARREIAERYGYDQVVIVARKTGEDGGEHVTTYGVSATHCVVAARIGRFFKHELMGWPEGEQVDGVPALAGFYWAKWRIADEGTPEGDEQTPSDKWEVVEVFENGIDEAGVVFLMASVPGQAKPQSLENFCWGRGPLVAPGKTPDGRS